MNKRGRPRKPSKRKAVTVKLHPRIIDELNSTVAPLQKSRFIEQAICDKLGVCHGEIVNKGIDV